MMNFTIIDPFEQGEGGEEEVEQAHAVVFPWFVEAVGLLVFFLLARYVKVPIPYTAVMFVVGMAMGIGAIRAGRDDQLSQSILMWSNIDNEVLLLVFLPGLIFRDALNVSFHLFTIGLYQILLLAFPMVLAGTVLTALVGYYIFPYDWSWFLALTFGSILSATDPVAVAALLAEVGAPPRLTMHISGESMFNDGSAMVFFNIFSAMFLYELGIEGLGAQVSLAEGFKIFFRLSLGGVAIGLAFAMGLIFVLYVLDRRLDKENNVVQVAATVTVAYLAFYVSEVASECSGVIAVVICGITTRAFGGGFINDPAMMEDFWVLLEHLLNTLLFTLGGVVWGTIIANSDERDNFEGKDWGYLLVLYIFLMIIRFASVGAFYPIVSRIGLKSNWQESVFMSFGGLRGAVGIALAISIDNSVRAATTDPAQRAFTNKLFGMVGGVAFLTLIINGTFAGPLLKKLGLTKSTEAAKKISEHFEILLKKQVLREYSRLLHDHRFAPYCTYDRVRHHVMYLKDVTDKEIDFVRQQAGQVKEHKTQLLSELTEARSVLKDGTSALSPLRLEGSDQFGVRELRLMFLEILRALYDRAVEQGYMDARADDGVVHYSLELKQSLDFAADEINRGGRIADWKYTSLADTAALNSFVGRASKLMSSDNHKLVKTRKALLKAMGFQSAHQKAREYLQAEFTDNADDALSEAAKVVLKESEEQESLASMVLSDTDKSDLALCVSNYGCAILLNKAAIFVKKYCRAGVISEQEAHGYLEEIDDAIKEVNISVMEHDQGKAESAVDEPAVKKDDIEEPVTKDEAHRSVNLSSIYSGDVEMTA